MTRLVIDDLEGVLDSDVMAVAMPEAVLDRSASPLNQGVHLLKDSWGILGMKMLRPALRILGHLLRGIPHDRAEILADESACKIPRGFSGVDDGRADGEQVLQALPNATEFHFEGLALGYVRPGA